MRPIPLALRAQLDADPYYHRCARWREGTCEGRVTWEHAVIYAGRQVNERWAIIPLCVYHHLGPGLVKPLNVYIAISRATEEDLARYPRRDWVREFAALSKQYANYPL